MSVRSLVLLFFMGLLAQLIDGTLGMGYGVTSTSLLLTMGIAPAIASASVHTSEVVVSFFSGVSHWKLGNARPDIWQPMALFGVPGGILGAYGLVNLPTTEVRLVIGTVLLLMGGVILFRFLRTSAGPITDLAEPPPTRSFPKLGALGFFAGFVDAMGGGGWGPICTPTLMIRGESPQIAVGSVNLAEFFVTVAITVTFMILLGFEEFPWDIVGVLMLSGIIAAPIAAWVCHRLPQRLLGILVGIMVILLSVRTIWLALAALGNV